MHSYTEGFTYSITTDYIGCHGSMMDPPLTDALPTTKTNEILSCCPDCAHTQQKDH